MAGPGDPPVDGVINVVGPNSAQRSSNFVFTVTISNNGPNHADGSSFTVDMPANSLDVRATCTGGTNGASCPTNLSWNNQTVTGTISTLPASPPPAVVTIRITGTFDSDQTSVTTTATLTVPSNRDETNPPTNSSTFGTALSGNVNIQTFKNQSTTNISDGATNRYTITYANTGVASLNDTITLGDQLSGVGGYDAYDWTATFVSCTPTGGVACPTFPASLNGSLTIPTTIYNTTVVGDWPNRATMTVVYDVTFTDNPDRDCGLRPNEIRNAASASVGTNQGTRFTTSDEARSRGQLQNQPCPGTDLRADKTQTNTALDATNNTNSYTITYANDGPADATDVTVMDTIRIRTGGALPFYTGVTLTLTSCTENGLTGACSQFPASIQRTFSSTGNAPTVYRFVIPSVPNGARVQVTYDAVFTGAGGPGTPSCGPTQTLWNSVFMFSSINDLVPQNNGNEAIASLPNVTCPPVDFEATVTQTSSQVVPNGTNEYEFTYRNVGNVDAQPGSIAARVVLSNLNGSMDTYDYEFVGCRTTGSATNLCPSSPTPSVVSGVPIFRSFTRATFLGGAALPTLPVGAGVVFTFRLTPRPAATSTCAASALAIRATTGIASQPSDSEPNTANNTDQVEASTPCADIAVGKSVSSQVVNPGGALDYEIEVSNAGPGTVTDLDIEDRLPPGTTLVSVSCRTASQCSSIVTAPTVVTATVISLAPGESAIIDLSLTAPTASGSFDNLAIAVPDPNNGNYFIDQNLSSNESRVSARTRALFEVTVVKEITGGPADGLDSPSDFTGEVTCGANSTGWTSRMQIGETIGSVDTVSVLDGDDCEVTEDLPLPAPPAGYEWGTPIISPASFTANGPLEIVVTNPLSVLPPDPVAAIDVTKTVDGFGRVVADWSFDFDLTSPDDIDRVRRVSGTGNASGTETFATASPGSTYSLTERSDARYAAGALTCVTEHGRPLNDTDGDVTNASMTFTMPPAEDDGTITDVECEITNTVRLGSLVVEKQVVGAAPDDVDFGFVVDCTSSGEALELPAATAEFRLSDDGTNSIDDLPLGTECTVAEIDAGGASSTTANGFPATSVTATIVETESVVLFVNTFDASPDLTVDRGPTPVDPSPTPDNPTPTGITTTSTTATPTLPRAGSDVSGPLTRIAASLVLIGLALLTVRGRRTPERLA